MYEKKKLYLAHVQRQYCAYMYTHDQFRSTEELWFTYKYDFPPLSESAAPDPMHMVRWLTNVGQDLPPTHACPPQACPGDLFGRLDAGTTEKHEHLLGTVGNSSTRADWDAIIDFIWPQLYKPMNILFCACK